MDKILSINKRRIIAKTDKMWLKISKHIFSSRFLNQYCSKNLKSEISNGIRANFQISQDDKKFFFS